MRTPAAVLPKLQIAVPFTPVPGRRLLGAPGPDEAYYSGAAAAAAAAAMRPAGGLSGARRRSSANAVEAPSAQRRLPATQRRAVPLANDGFSSFEDFLRTLSSRHRKASRSARRAGGGLVIEWLTGADITEEHWDAFFEFYLDTGSRKWGRPYLNRGFFSLLAEAMADRCC